MLHHLFLSYSRKDTTIMQRVRDDFCAEGLTVWTDEGIEAGTQLWKDAIQQAIEAAGCLLVILSPDSKQSIWVKRELDYASAQKVKIFSVLARGDESSAVPFAIIGSQYVDIRTDYVAGLEKLLPAICKHVGVESFTQRDQRLAQEEAQRLTQEAEQQRLAEIAAREKAKEAERQRQAELTARQKAEEEEAQWQAEEAERQRQAEEDARQKAEEQERQEQVELALRQKAEKEQALRQAEIVAREKAEGAEQQRQLQERERQQHINPLSASQVVEPEIAFSSTIEASPETEPVRPKRRKRRNNTVPPVTYQGTSDEPTIEDPLPVPQEAPSADPWKRSLGYNSPNEPRTEARPRFVQTVLRKLLSPLVAVLVGTLLVTAVAFAFVSSNDLKKSAALTQTAIAEPTLDPNAGYPGGTKITANKQWTPVTQNFNTVKMVLVPAGCFLLGSNDGDRSEQPVNQQCFEKPFWIDRYDVTNDQFAQFSQFKDPQSQPGPNRPRETFTWFEARDFCQKRGARLPTEAEWEYAARGPDDLVYPWGNAFIADNVIYYGNSDYQIWDVGSKPGGVSWVGALDMGGNVSQWVSSIYKTYPYDATDGRESSADTNSPRVVRGSEYNTGTDYLRASIRHGYVPTLVFGNFGFRCAADYMG